jgi:hypothetical protein
LKSLEREHTAGLFEGEDMNTRSQIIISIFAVLIVTGSVRAQSPALSQCPEVEVSRPYQAYEGKPITFTASLTGGDRAITPTYSWTVSAGKISSGQGTSKITVDTTGLGGMSSTATVNIGGYDRRCQTTQSDTTEIKPKTDSPEKIDEYGDELTLKQRNERLDNYAIEFEKDPTARGYIIAYGGRASPPGAATSLMNTAKKYLVDTRSIEESRIVTVDGGYREFATTQLWLVPEGITPPQADPTIDPSEIKAPKTKKPVPKPATIKEPT